MSRVAIWAFNPKLNLVGAFLSAFAEVVSWFTNFDDAYRITPIAFLLCLYFISMLGIREHIRAEGLQAQLKPSVQIVFDPPSNPLYDSLHFDRTLRHIRVSVWNPAPGTPVQDLAVKVTRVLPQTAGVFPMQELRRTHSEPPVSRFTVNPSTEPLNFVEFISQSIDVASERTTHIGIDFAGGRRLLSLDVDQYLLWLEIDGPGAVGPRKFVLRRNKKLQYVRVPEILT